MTISEVFRKIKLGFLLSFVGVIVQGLVGVILIPLLLNYLSESRVAIWVLFMSFTNFIFIGQAGLSMESINRVNKIISQKNQSNFWSVNSTSYNIVKFTIIIILSFLFPFYVEDILIEKDYLFFGTIMWFILLISHVLNLSALRYIHLLNAIKEVGWDKGVKIVIVIFQIVGYYLILINNYGLVAIVTVYMISSLINYFLAKKLFHKKNLNFVQTEHIPYKLSDILNFFKPVSKIFILNISSFIVLSSNYYIIPAIVDIDLLPYYGALMKICMILLTITGSITSLFYPFINQAFLKNNYYNFKRLYFTNICLIIISCLVLSTIIMIIVPIIYPIWMNSSTYLGNYNLLLMLLIISVYSISVVFSSVIIAMNSKKFVSEAIMQSLLSIVLAVLLGLKLGIYGILLGNFLGILMPTIIIVVKSYKILNRVKLV